MRRVLAIATILLACAPAARGEPAGQGAAPGAPTPAPGAGRVVLANGDEIHGEIEAQDDSTLVLLHPQLGRLEIARVGIRELVPEPGARADSGTTSDGEGGAAGDGSDGAADGASIAATAADPTAADDGEPERKSGFLGTRLLRGWKSSFGAGLTGSFGGFEDTKLNVIFTTGVRDERRRWDFDPAYFINVAPKNADDAKNVNKNQGFATLRRDWFFPERWKKFFAWAQAAYNYDQFQPWEHRVGGHVGPGYQLLSSETWELDGRIGVGVSRTFGSRDTTSPEAMFGFGLKWTPVA